MSGPATKISPIGAKVAVIRSRKNKLATSTNPN